MSASYAAIYNKANCAASQTLSPTAYQVLMMLAAHANGLGVVSISQRRLAEHIRKSAAIVNRSLPKLIETGCITYHRRGIYNRQTKRMFPNIYQVNPDILHLRPADLPRARQQWENYNGKPLSLTYDGQSFPPCLQPEQPEQPEADLVAAADQPPTPFDHVHPDVGTTNGASAKNDHVYSEGNEAAPTMFTPPENPPDTMLTPGGPPPKNHVDSKVNMVIMDSTILPSDPPLTMFTLDETCLHDHVYSGRNVSSFKNFVVVAAVQSQEKPPQQSFVVSEDAHESNASSNEKTSDDGMTPSLPATTSQQPADTVQSGITESKRADTPALKDQVPPDSYQNNNLGDNSEANTKTAEDSAEDDEGEWVSPPPPPFIPRPADPDNPPRTRRAYADFAAITSPLPDPDDEALARTLQKTTYMLLSRARGLVAQYGRAAVVAGQGYMANIQDEITHPAGYLIWLLGSGQIHPVEDAPLTKPANPYLTGKYADIIEH